jgi:hypothetical protein
MLLVDCRNEIGFCFALGAGGISSDLGKCFLVLSCLCVRQSNGSIRLVAAGCWELQYLLVTNISK